MDRRRRAPARLLLAVGAIVCAAGVAGCGDGPEAPATAAATAPGTASTAATSPKRQRGLEPVFWQRAVRVPHHPNVVRIVVVSGPDTRPRRVRVRRVRRGHEITLLAPRPPRYEDLVAVGQCVTVRARGVGDGGRLTDGALRGKSRRQRRGLRGPYRDLARRVRTGKRDCPRLPPR